MLNASKQAVLDAIDAAGYSFQVVETDPKPLVEGEKIVITETVTFIATKRTEVALP